MTSLPVRLRSALLASAAALMADAASAQSPAPNALPAATVEAPALRRAAAPRPRREARPMLRAAPRAAPLPSPAASGPSVPGALTVATAQQALQQIQRTPGGVALVTADAWRNSTVSNSVKDILDYVPGVIAQTKWGDDTRLSIRGSGLSRNFHLRG
ncbi:MAG: TonB-dependent receptor plug domain-containing protein, partial [Pseudorhodoplanes sp.]